MSDRLAVTGFVVLVMGICPFLSALDFCDDFSKTHDYLAGGTAGSTWDGVLDLAGSISLVRLRPGDQ